MDIKDIFGKFIKLSKLIIDRLNKECLRSRNMDYQEPTTTKPNFVSRQSLHVKVDEITMKLTGIRPGWSGLCCLVGY